MNPEDLGPGPDIDSIDTSKLDRGDTFGEPAPDPVPAPDDKLEDVFPEGKSDEKPEGEEPAEEKPEGEEPAEEKPEQPRDEGGKFAKKEKGDPNLIPKSRFNEAVGKEREAREAAEKRAAELEQQLRARQQSEAQQVTRDEHLKALEGEVDKLTEQHQQLMLDGETAKAAELMKQIRTSERQIARLEAQAEAQSTVSAAIEQDRVNAAIARIEADYPVLNPQSAEYDADLVQMILMWQGRSIAEGMSPSQALVEATQKVMGRIYQPKAEAPAAEAKGLSNQKPVLDVASERTRAAVEKSLATQKSQPTNTAALGMDSDKAGDKELPKASEMTVEEYAALPEATRARLRGDLV